MYHIKDLILLKKMQKKNFPMAFDQTDIDGFKSDLFLLPYGPLEPIVINFTCDFSLVCIPPRWSPLKWCAPPPTLYMHTTRTRLCITIIVSDLGHHQHLNTIRDQPTKKTLLTTNINLLFSSRPIMKIYFGYICGNDCDFKLLAMQFITQKQKQISHLSGSFGFLLIH